jgi:hypothetical protein
LFVGSRTAGVKDFRFHDFRHDLATKLLRATGHLKTVQKALSHADIKTTTRYAHVLDEEVAAAMESLQTLHRSPEQSPELESLYRRNTMCLNNNLRCALFPGG